MPTLDRRGFTLIETLIALAIIAVLSGLGYPRLRSFMLKSNVRSARSTVINTVQQAKARASMEGRSVTVNLDNTTGKMWTTAAPRRTVGGAGTCSCDTVGAIANLTQQYGVTVRAANSPSSANPHTFGFDLRGLGTGGSTMTVLLVRDSYQDSVYVSSYGRVSK